MTTLYMPFLKVQQAVWESWLSLFRANLQICEHLGAVQVKLFEEHPYFRINDAIADGADWTDHYGRRNHDIDIEKV